MKRKFKIAVVILAVILIIGIIQTIPVFFLKLLGARELVGKAYVNEQQDVILLFS